MMRRKYSMRNKSKKRSNLMILRIWTRRVPEINVKGKTSWVNLSEDNYPSDLEKKSTEINVCKQIKRIINVVLHDIFSLRRDLLFYTIIPEPLYGICTSHPHDITVGHRLICHTTIHKSMSNKSVCYRLLEPCTQLPSDCTLHSSWSCV
jgi:hypothetical protein